jgi:hypothetical protein
MEGGKAVNMNAWSARAGCGLVLAILVGSLVAGCAAQATTGAFTQTNRIESELKQGISTKMDVQRVLGTPKGSGNAVFPIDPRPREVWYYQDIEMTDATSEAGIFRVNVRQQILLVFFEKGVFDGFMWWSNAGVAKGE